MSQDIIRSTKEHEVVIPEGSINAKSRTSTVGVSEVEPEHIERVATTNTVIDRRVSVDDSTSAQSANIKLATDETAAQNRVRLPESEQGENRALLPDESINDNKVLLPPTGRMEDHRVKLPSDVSDLQAPQLAFNEQSHSQAAAAPVDSISGQAQAVISSPAQVAASLADKRRQEFVGRVVKLREEVDHLNQRLDHLEK